MSNTFLQHSLSCLEEGSAQPHQFSPLPSTKVRVSVCICSAKLLFEAAPHLRKPGWPWMGAREGLPRPGGGRGGWWGLCRSDGLGKASASPGWCPLAEFWLKTVCPGSQGEPAGWDGGVPPSSYPRLARAFRALGCPAPERQVPRPVLPACFGHRKEEGLLANCFCEKQTKTRRREGWTRCHRCCRRHRHRHTPPPPPTPVLISPFDGGNIEKK